MQTGMDDRSRDALRHRIPAWGVDSDAETRPGVPRWDGPPSPQEAAPGVPAHPLHWQARRRGRLPPPRAGWTPVFGTAQPLRPAAPSTWVRRLAYRIPQDKSEHWLLLILGDRMDVWEHRLLGPVILGGLLAAMAGGLAATGSRTLLSALAGRLATGGRAPGRGRRWVVPRARRPAGRWKATPVWRRV